MSTRPFHHGNLRASLLDEALRTLRAGGVEALSLRQLARAAGVSHAAPRHHFPDRQALLDALAVEGFETLTASVAAAWDAPAASNRQRFRHAAYAYLDFAMTDAALMELMFGVKHAGSSSPVQRAAQGFFAEISKIVAEGTSTASGSVQHARLQLLVAATLQGLASMVNSGRLPQEEIGPLLDQAVAAFSSSTATSPAEVGDPS